MPLNLTGGHAHFSGTGAEEINFSRSLTQLYIHTASGTTISFDGGVNYMTLANDTTHKFPYPHTKQILLGAGTWSGVGISV